MKTKIFLSYGLVLLMGCVVLNGSARAEGECKPMKLTIRNIDIEGLRVVYGSCPHDWKSLNGKPIVIGENEFRDVNLYSSWITMMTTDRDILEIKDRPEGGVSITCQKDLEGHPKCHISS